jgi:4-amino-4-deoxy-L-arabinose transferase-like glycosyltransferase
MGMSQGTAEGLALTRQAATPPARPVVAADRKIWAAIAVAAVLLRVGHVMATRPLVLRGDAIDYNRLGRLIAAGHGFGVSWLSPSGGPTSLRAPAYPIFLGAVYKLTGDSVTAARLVQALLGVGLVLLVGLIAHLVWGRRVALAAGAIAAVYPPLIIVSGSVLSESLFVPLVVSAVACALLARRPTRTSRRLVWLASAGVLAGLSSLARPNGGAIVLGLVALAVTAMRPRRRVVAGVATLLAAVVVVLVPWEVRDAIEMHAFVPVTTVDGFTLATVYNAPAARHDYRVWVPPNVVPQLAPLFHDRSLNELTLNNELRKKAFDWINAHPTSVPRVSYLNTLRMGELTGLNPSAQEGLATGAGRRTVLLSMGAFWLIGVLAAAGILTRRARRAPLGIWLVPLSLWVISMPIEGSARLRAPIDPFLVLAAAVFVTQVRSRVGRC